MVSKIKVLCKPFPTNKSLASLNLLLSSTNDSTNDNLSRLGKVMAAFDKTKIWKDKDTLTVSFLPWKGEEAEDWRKAWVEYIIKTKLQPYVGIKFNFLDYIKQDADITITFDPNSGSYSRIGSDSLDKNTEYRESMNLGWIDAPKGKSFKVNGQTYIIPQKGRFLSGGGGLEGGTIVHEFCHALGMIHEHQTPFDNKLHWNLETVYRIFSGPPNNWTKEQIRQNIIFNYDNIGNVFNGSSFDPKSIMKYRFENGFEILNRSKYNSDEEFEQAVQYVGKANIELSPLDKYWLQKNYPSGSEPPIDISTIEAKSYDSDISLGEKFKNFFKHLSTLQIILGIVLLFILLLFFIFFFKK